MKTKVLFRSMLAATVLAASACSDNLKDEVEVIDPSSKAAITFVGQDNSAKLTRAGFEANTLIAMHIRSTKDASNIRETRTWATALKDNDLNSSSYSVIDAPADENVRYWDDAYGRSAKLSVFAIAVPGYTVVKNNSVNLADLLAKATGTWNAGALSENVAWVVSGDQSAAGVIAAEDLTYSNNISNGGKGGAKAYNYTSNSYAVITDGQLQFRLKDVNFQDGPGKFDQGNLKFNHALSRITINLIKGTGYGDGSFSFEDGTNVKIIAVPTSGTLNIETGAWTTTASAGISKMATATLASGASYSLVAQVLPGYVINKDNDTNVLEFIIDDNKYFITQGMMFSSLDGKDGITEKTTSSITMEKGRNYVFNITVGKSKIINVSATLEPWIDVTAADQTMDNSHITLDLFESNGTASSNFDLYRLNDESAQINTGASTDKHWAGNYTEKAVLSDAGNGKWKTSWFFENNKSFYHFRTVNKNTAIKENDTDVDDYFEVSSGAQATNDYHWGAPFISSTTSPIQYDKDKGYADFLSPAIGATNSTISLTELHMMSNINVVLRTTKTSNAVELEVNTDQCEVTLTHFYANGQVKMGNGLVSITGNLTDAAAFTKPAAGIDETDATYKKTGAFTFAAVPQTLVRNSGSELYVGITIKTPDNNQYYVVKALSDIIATANGNSQNQPTSGKIDFWYPNHSYTYTFTLTKAGIDDVTCTVQDWVSVTADNQNISLED